jgi:hypothetical protein
MRIVLTSSSHLAALKSRPLPLTEDFAYRQPHLDFDEFEALSPIFPESNFDLYHLKLAVWQRGTLGGLTETFGQCCGSGSESGYTGST